MAISGTYYEAEDCKVKYRDRFNRRSPSKHRTVRQRINTYGAEFTGNVECLECHRKFKSLNGHLVKHGLNPAQYRSKYPAAPLLDDSVYGAGTPLRQRIGDLINAHRAVGHCDFCHKEVRAAKYEHRLGIANKRRFCSVECRQQGKRNPQRDHQGEVAYDEQCRCCGQTFRTFPSRAQHFCSRLCYWRMAAQIPNSGRFHSAIR